MSLYPVYTSKNLREKFEALGKLNEEPGEFSWQRIVSQAE